MIHEIFTLIWALTLLSVQSSLVRDATEPKGIFLEEYCPGLGSCPEGSHVLCMYYTPGKVTGPRCYQPMNISMTADLAGLILDINNAVRSKLALGKETGKGGLPLPRAYGMNKLKWDNELATFAQVMANQCILRHDLCRASKKFENPGQAVGLVRFTYPDWLPVSAGAKFKTAGLIAPKLTYAVTQAIRSWYHHKDYITKEVVEKHPDFEKVDSNGKLYLQMVHHKATHIGCGIIGYTEYAYHDNNANLVYNSIQIICNYSAKPKFGQPAYETSPPDQPGYTVRCGCPPGFEEDSACLCDDIVDSEKMYCDGKKCKPAVVLLPIFTVEDAPQNVLRRLPSVDTDDEFNEIVVANLDEHQASSENFKIFPDNSIYEESFKQPVIYPYEETTKKSNRIPGKTAEVPKVKPRYFNKKPKDDHPTSFIRRIMPKAKKRGDEKKKFVKKTITVKKKQPSKVMTKKYAVKKKNIFSDAPKFTLTKSKSKPKVKIVKSKPNEIKKYSDVEIDDVDKSKLELEHNSRKGKTKAIKHKKQIKLVTDSDETNNIFVNSTMFKRNKYQKNKFKYFDASKELNGFSTDVRNINEEADNKLMNLLDTLEQEVKHIELDGSEKEILDAKIRRIYGSLVGKKVEKKIKLESDTEYVPPLDHIPVDDVEDMNKVVDKQMQQMSDTEDRVQMDKQIYSDSEFMLPEAKRGLAIDRQPASMYTPKEKSFHRPLSINQYQNEETISDDEPMFTYRKNKVQNLNKLKLNDIDTDTDPFVDRTRPRNDFQDRSLYRSDNLKSRDAFLENRFSRNNKRFDSDNDIRGRTMYKPDEYTVKDNKAPVTDYSSDDMRKPRFEEDVDGNLDFDRRQYYQEKLNKLERKLHGLDENSRHATHQREISRRLIQSSGLRPQNELHKRMPIMRRPGMMNPTFKKQYPRSSKMGYYLPERSRSLHSFR